jgi:hypothetical protein
MHSVKLRVWTLKLCLKVAATAYMVLQRDLQFPIYPYQSLADCRSSACSHEQYTTCGSKEPSFPSFFYKGRQGKGEFRAAALADGEHAHVACPDFAQHLLHLRELQQRRRRRRGGAGGDADRTAGIIGGGNKALDGGSFRYQSFAAWMARRAALDGRTGAEPGAYMKIIGSFLKLIGSRLIVAIQYRRVYEKY